MITISDFGLVRIDDRLIHGQVVAVWCKHKNFKRIIILDDGVAKDSFMQQVLRLAAPPGIQVEAMEVEANIELLNALPNKESVMLLMKTPQTAKRLFDAGLQFSALNIGGMGMMQGRKNVYRNISMSDDEKSMLKELSDKGVKIALYILPNDKSKPFTDLV
ncbi:MAG TPA: PTS sugar transporter subunit IIB [Anaerolineaceae bacterium]|nr:PTS sugar transporter subunit IIB [Anaerolineaceae bacterium]